MKFLALGQAGGTRVPERYQCRRERSALYRGFRIAPLHLQTADTLRVG